MVSGLIGLTLGAIAGYRGGWADTVVSRLLEAQLSLPLLMMLLLVVALFGPSIPVDHLRDRHRAVARDRPPDPVPDPGRTREAIRRRARTCWAWAQHRDPAAPHRAQHHQAGLAGGHCCCSAQAVLLESALSYLGAGPQRPFATWGRIISDGQDYVTTSWWLVTLPGLVIALLVVGVNLLGDGLRDRTGGPKPACSADSRCARRRQ